MSQEVPKDWFKTIVLGVAATCTVGFFGWVATSVNAMADRLTTIEVTMRENKAEREAQVADLRARVGRLEDERAYRNARRRDDNGADDDRR